MRENMLKIGQELGASAAFVVGANGEPQRQFYDFLSNISTAKFSNPLRS